MADPLRRTILAKLRGKKPKGKDASNANRAREGKEKVFQTQTDRDYLSHEMRGEGIRTAGLGCSAVPRCAVAAAVRVTGGRADAHRSGGSGPGGPAGVSDQSERTELKRFHTIGDSIGFGGCDLKPKREALKPTDGQDLKNKETNVTLLEQKAGKIITGDFRSPKPSEAPHLFDYIDGNIHESDLIQVIESSLEYYHGDFNMPALQSPTFFPTELEITAAPGLRDGAPRHHSVDSEDDDYYDNQILPFYESCAQKHCSEQISESGSAQETDRLKSQLKEAYYLLLNTMHNISFDSQVEDNGFAEASSSSQSHDSVSSQSTDKRTGSDACLSEERSAQSDSAFFAFRGRCGGTGFTGSSQSRSLQNILKAESKSTLQRSVSDSRVKYSSFTRTCEEPASAYAAQPVSAHAANPTEILPTPVQSCADAAVPKHPGVTVNKMQEWMQKGRVLSSEMKQRIAGSSLRANHGGRMRKAGMDAGWRGGRASIISFIWVSLNWCRVLASQLTWVFHVTRLVEACRWPEALH